MEPTLDRGESQSILPDNLQNAEEDALNRIFEKQIEVQSILFDRAATYNNVVVTMGYAGFFGILAYAKDSLDPRDIKLIVVLLGLSLFLFVIWTVVTSFVNAMTIMPLSKILMLEVTPTQKLLLITTQQKMAKRANLVYYNTWYFVFFISLISGFGAGLLLLGLIISDVLGFDFSLYCLLTSKMCAP